MKNSVLVIFWICAGLGLSRPALAAPAGRLVKAPDLTKPNLSRPLFLKDTTENSKKTGESGSSIDDLLRHYAQGTDGIRLNPYAIGFVQDYMENHEKDLLQMHDWATPYFNMMDGVLKDYGLPGELKYLAVIESQLRTSAVSRAGAVGPWQFMAETARLMGLRVTRKMDERRDFIKSTHAAARYLNELYKEFGDWLLVIAAYNGGPGNVYSAIRRSGTRNFWMMQRFLPNETRTHVKKFIATHYIFEGQGGVTTLTSEETATQLGAVSNFVATRNLSPEELVLAKTMRVSGKYHSQAIIRIIIMDSGEFNRYNPHFDQVMASAANSYELKLPPEKMELFVSNKYQILNESVQILLNAATAAAESSEVVKPAQR